MGPPKNSCARLIWTCNNDRSTNQKPCACLACNACWQPDLKGWHAQARTWATRPHKLASKAMPKSSQTSMLADRLAKLSCQQMQQLAARPCSWHTGPPAASSCRQAATQVSHISRTGVEFCSGSIYKLAFRLTCL